MIKEILFEALELDVGLAFVLSLVKPVKCLADIGFEAGSEFEVDVGDKAGGIHLQEIGIDDNPDAAAFLVDVCKTQNRAGHFF